MPTTATALCLHLLDSHLTLSMKSFTKERAELAGLDDFLHGSRIGRKATVTEGKALLLLGSVNGDIYKPRINRSYYISSITVS